MSLIKAMIMAALVGGEIVDEVQKVWISNELLQSRVRIFLPFQWR